MGTGNYFAPFSLRIPEELIEKIKHIASVNKRSANKEMEYILQSYAEDWEKTHEKINLRHLEQTEKTPG